MELTSAQKALIQRIKQLKCEKQAKILCHNYQRPEIYEVADFIGDSLGLCEQARRTPARMIVFCGVYFMAESAAILNPQKKVVIPAPDAGCALSDMITAKSLRERKKEYPDAAVVCYVNSTAEVKAESDICCTSSNAVQVVRALPNRQILFVPDKNLAKYAARQIPEKQIIPWEGYCPIHERLSAEFLLRARKMYPDAKIIAHPECTKDVLEIADYIASTNGMIKVARGSKAKRFICTTECGMIQRLKHAVPDKQFFTVCSVCFDMKKITLERVAQSLLNEQFEVKLPETVRKKAYAAFERMFAITAEQTGYNHPVRSNLPQSKIKSLKTLRTTNHSPTYCA